MNTAFESFCASLPKEYNKWVVSVKRHPKGFYYLYLNSTLEGQFFYGAFRLDETSDSLGLAAIFERACSIADECSQAVK